MLTSAPAIWLSGLIAWVPLALVVLRPVRPMLLSALAFEVARRRLVLESTMAKYVAPPVNPSIAVPVLVYVTGSPVARWVADPRRISPVDGLTSDVRKFCAVPWPTSTVESAFLKPNEIGKENRSDT